MAFAYVAGGLIIILAGILLWRCHTSAAGTGKSVERVVMEAAPDALEHLSGAIQIPTVSCYDEEKIDKSQFRAFHAYLEQTYPGVHRAMERCIMEDGSVYFRWKGTDEMQLPGAFMAHMDVVPVQENEQWKYPPFAGTVAEGYIWGRGTIDMKGQLIAILEAAERLIQSGFNPTRDYYFIFGSDEELANNSGARKIKEKLEASGIRFEFVLDEGATIKDGAAYFIKKDVALIGIGEKGYIDLEIIARQPGGHASVPPPHTAVGLVAAAVERLEKQPMKLQWNAASKAMFDGLLPQMDWKHRFFYANRWLFGRLLLRKMAKDPAMAALFRTTCAATMASGSSSSNILPSLASVTCNLRVAPEQSCKSALEHVRKRCGDQCEIRVLRELEPSAVSKADDETFQKISDCIRRTMEVETVAPCPVVVGTDSRNFHDICDHVYRFVPFHSAKQDADRMHAVDERLEVKSFYQGIAFFQEIMKAFS